VDYTAFSEALFPFISEVGYLALSLVSFFGSLIPFVPLPSFLVLATMAVGDQFNIHILALLSAVTATLAKQIIFYVSYRGGRIISEKTRKRMKPFERLVKRYGAGAAFVAAATPIPDDLVYIPLGLAKYNPRRFFVATLTGKIVLSYVIVLTSHFVGLSLLDPLVENIKDTSTIYIGMIVFGASLTAMIILLLRLDWARILRRFAPWTLIEEDKKD
jgi:membrane protein DedA with SNARE-associated domain